MDKFLYLLGPIGCAVMMGVCLRSMARGMRRADGQAETEQADEIAALRAEVAELRAERSATRDG